MKRTSAAVMTAFLGLATAATLSACAADVPTPSDPCVKNPKGKGCAAPATSASTYQTAPVTSVPPPAAIDAGTDARPHKPDAGGPLVPPANAACTDLLRCCGKVKDSLERAACMGIGYKASPDTCANAVIAYQVFGGCGHDPFSLPDIFNSDGTTNESKDCTYLEEACIRDATQCDAAYACDGTTYSGDSPTPTDPCGDWSATTKPNGQNDYDCCVFNDTLSCCGDDNAGCY